MKAYTLLIKAFALIGLCGLCYVYGHNKGFEKGTKACNEYLEEKVTFPNESNYEDVADLRSETEY